MVIMCEITGSTSVSTAKFYDGKISEYSDADVDAARILMSLSSSPSGILLPPAWRRTRKRTRMYDITEEVMLNFNSLQSVMGQSPDTALKVLKTLYKWNKEIVAGIESFEFLRSEGLDGDQMLEVLNAVKKRKIDVKNPNKQNTDMEMKKVSELIGEDDLKEGIKNYECKECKEVFASFQALGGHIASHNRKKKTEEAIQTLSNLSETIFGNGGEKNCVYKCNECSKSFSTGQALGGHKTYHRKIAEVAEEACAGEQVKTFQFDFDLNASPDDYRSISSSELELQPLRLLPE